MKGEIIAAMASDMNIQKFHTETNVQYTYRIIYSAIACWIKAAALDHNVGETSPNAGSSKKHIYQKCTQLLSSMIERYPEMKPLFYTGEDSEDPIKCIRRRLVQNGDLVNIGFETNMTLVPYTVRPISSNIEQVCGTFFDKTLFYCGISAMRKSTNDNISNNITSISDWLEQFVATAWFEPGSINHDTCEYFNSFKNTRNIHTCWQKNETEFCHGIRLVRIIINANMYEYYLEKYKNGSVYHHKLDPFLVDIKEHRKIMFALRKMSNTPLPAHMTLHSDHATLNLWVHSPYELAKYLESFTWPSRHISDVLEWKIPICLTSEIKQKLMSIGMTVTEENHG